METSGYRYYHLAKTAQLGSRFHDVPFSEYEKIRQVLIEHAKSIDELGHSFQELDSEQAVHDLSHEDVEQIVQKLRDVLVHVYEVVKRTETKEMIDVHLQFVDEAEGL